MRFAITGSTGMIGSHLTRQLRVQGHEVTRVIRSYADLPPGERAVVWHPDENVIEAHGLEEHDVVIHLASASLAGVWTESRKRLIWDSRQRSTGLIARTIAGLTHQPRAFISISGSNYYGDRPPDEEVDEMSAPGTGFLAEVCQMWEAETRPAKDAGVRVINARLGMVISKEGGVLGPLLPLFKLGLGAKLGSGRQLWPWIAMGDLLPAMLHVLERPEISGPVNFVAPQAVSNEQFTNALAGVLHRPSFFKLPAFAARLAPGGMADEMLLAGARVVPRKLLDSGYAFRFPTLEGALRAELT